jgi:hypothetical protein
LQRRFGRAENLFHEGDLARRRRGRSGAAWTLQVQRDALHRAFVEWHNRQPRLAFRHSSARRKHFGFGRLFQGQFSFDHEETTTTHATASGDGLELNQRELRSLLGPPPRQLHRRRKVPELIRISVIRENGYAVHSKRVASQLLHSYYALITSTSRSTVSGSFVTENPSRNTVVT